MNSLKNWLNSPKGKLGGFLGVVLLGMGLAFFWLASGPSPAQIRDLCSCIYIRELSEGFCRDELKISSKNVVVQMQPPQVTFKQFTSSYVSERLGCSETIDSSLKLASPK